MGRTRTLLGTLALGAMLLAACTSDVSVGSGVDTNVGGGTQADGRLGARPTPSPSETVSEPPAPEPTTEVATQPPPPEPTEAPPPPPEPTETGPVIAFEVKITGDQSGTSQFDPSASSIYAGTCVRWVNADTQARSVEADDGSFASPMLDPGQDFVFCPTEARRYNYHDGTRPYAVAFLEVVPQ